MLLDVMFGEGKRNWEREGICILTFHLLFDTFCNVKPVLKQHKGDNLKNTSASTM